MRCDVVQYWQCYKCKKKYRIGHSVGLTNSVADRTLCVKCYNGLASGEHLD
jgi:hypothetical protein